MAPSFEAHQGFGFSKPAHVPCSHLKSDFSCRIHPQLLERGFPACRAFDCYGAGQRVTRLFGAWRESAAVFRAYSQYRGLHELLAMLELAVEHAPPEARRLLQQRLEWLEGLCESAEALSAVTALDVLRAEVLAEIRAAVGGAPGVRAAEVEEFAQE